MQPVSAVEEEDSATSDYWMVCGGNAALHWMYPINTAGLTVHGEERAEMVRSPEVGAAQVHVKHHRDAKVLDRPLEIMAADL
jgi:hypothetical protein